ncbi:MAG: MmgE/PrpD family protein [Desulfobacterales bacterium]|nr:MAG: MmgE/PrpD family protein [Desulfobacterales bacterium]
MRLTKEIVQRCHDLSFNTLSEEVIDRVKYLLLDYIGVAVRGSLSESSRPVHRFIRNVDKREDGAVVFGTNIRAIPPYAALANGIAAHSVELDDVVNEASLHPAVAIMTAAVAAANMITCTGKEFIEAIVAGYEVTTKLGIALDPAAHYAQGFHPTGTCGTMGAAITVSKILKSDQQSMLNAFGIAGSQAAGSMEFLTDGAFTKRFHPGWAAHSGIIAACLAREKLTGPSTIIEGRFGFLHAYSPKSNSSKVLENWGNPYEVMRTSIKPHACCRYKQGPIDGILQIMHENQLTASDIEKVNLAILKAGVPLIAEPEEIKYNPKSIVDAQFSMPFGAAVAIMFGKATLDEYTMENIASVEVKSMMNKIYCVEDKEIEKEFPKKWPALVTIITKTRKKYSTKIEYPKGDPENPFSWNELIAKFQNLVSPVYSETRQKQILDNVRSLEQAEDINNLSILLAKE